MDILSSLFSFTSLLVTSYWGSGAEQDQLPVLFFSLESIQPHLDGALASNFKTLVITDPKNSMTYRISVEGAAGLSQPREPEDYLLFPQYPERSQPPPWVQKGYPVIELQSQKRFPLNLTLNARRQLSLQVSDKIIPVANIESILFAPLVATASEGCNLGSFYLVNFLSTKSSLTFSTECQTWVPTSGVSTGNF